jgi:hypothetical protein
METDIILVQIQEEEKEVVLLVVPSLDLLLQLRGLLHNYCCLLLW